VKARASLCPPQCPTPTTTQRLSELSLSNRAATTPTSSQSRPTTQRLSELSLSNRAATTPTSSQSRPHPQPQPSTLTPKIPHPQPQPPHPTNPHTPQPPKGIPIDGKTVFTSDHALKMEWLPQWIAIIGSGYIGLEFSDVYTALGCEVGGVWCVGGAWCGWRVV